MEVRGGVQPQAVGTGRARAVLGGLPRCARAHPACWHLRQPVGRPTGPDSTPRHCWRRTSRRSDLGPVDVRRLRRRAVVPASRAGADDARELPPRPEPPDHPVVQADEDGRHPAHPRPRVGHRSRGRRGVPREHPAPEDRPLGGLHHRTQRLRHLTAWSRTSTRRSIPRVAGSWSSPTRRTSAPAGSNSIPIWSWRSARTSPRMVFSHRICCSASAPSSTRPSATSPHRLRPVEQLGLTEPNDVGRRYTHGTLSAYTAGRCRCVHCRAAFANYRAERRANCLDSPRGSARVTRTGPATRLVRQQRLAPLVRRRRP